MADYDPMNPVHAGPKSPKIKATIRGGGYTLPYPNVPSGGNYPTPYDSRPKRDPRDRGEQEIRQPKKPNPFKTPFDLPKAASEIKKDYIGSYKEKVEDLPKINTVPTLGSRGAMGELKTDPNDYKQQPMGYADKPKNNKKPVKKEPVKKAVVIHKKIRPKGD